MAITVNFKEKYKHLINNDIPKHQVRFGAGSENGVKATLPAEYSRKFVSPPDGFVALYCEEY